MGVRTLGGLVALLLVGAGLGWALADVRTRPDPTGAAPRPLAASDPALPFTPPEKTKPDPDVDPLPTRLPLHEEQLGTRRQDGIVVAVPDGWERTTHADNRTATWVPADAPDGGGYTVRVALTPENRTLAQKVLTRPLELEQDSRVSDLEVLDSSLDTLTASFIISGYRRLTVIRWVSLDGDGLVDVEVAATGRLVDRAGMEALVLEMDRSLGRQPARSQNPGADTPSSTS